MTDQPEHVDATVYAVIVPTWRRYGGKDDRGRAILDSAKVDSIRQTRPTALPRGAGS